MSKIIEIPFGAKDSENKGWEYTIPAGMEAVIEDGKVIVREKESEDENLKNKSGYYKAGKFWKASTLWNATKDKIPQRVPNRYILQECVWNIGTLQQFADEIKNVQEVSLDYPIILDMNGNILDGAHRVVKAYLEGKDIDIVYLGDDEWPEPDYDEEKAVKDSEDERIRKFLKDYAIEMIAGLESDISISVYDGVKGHDPDAEEELEKWRGARAWLEKQKEQKPAEWSEEDEALIENVCTALKGYALHERKVDLDEHAHRLEEMSERLKSLRPQPQQNMSIGFMLYLDEHRPDGKMCLSNAECNQLEIAFRNQDWSTILKYAEKYLPHWKPSEEHSQGLPKVTISRGKF